MDGTVAVSLQGRRSSRCISLRMDWMARGDVGVGRTALRQHFDQHRFPYRPSQNSLVSNGKQPEEKDTEPGNPEEQFAIDNFCGLSLAESLSLLLSNQRGKAALLCSTRCSEKGENMTTETHTRTSFSFKQCCTKSIIYAQPAFKMGLLCSPAGAQGAEFYTTWKMPFASQAYAWGRHWDSGNNLIYSNSCRQPKMEISRGSRPVFHCCGAHSLFWYHST